MKTKAFYLESDLLLKKDEDDFLNIKKITLLENVQDYGSIAKASKASGITYKTAWNWIDKMNRLSPSSLVEKVSGGKDGGGTVVTTYAKELMRIYYEIDALHQKHLASLQSSLSHLEGDITKNTFSFSRLDAEIAEIHKNEKSVEYLLKLKCGSNVIAYSSIKFMTIHALEVGSKLVVLVESDAVSVSKADKKEISSRNKLKTKIIDIIFEDKDVLLTLSLSENQNLTSRITLKSFEDLQLEKGNEIMAIFKAYNVTLLQAGGQ